MKLALPRILVFVLLGVGVAAAGAQPIGADAARHLLNRTGFAAHAAQIAEVAKLSRTEAVDRLLAGAVPVARTPAPAWTTEFISPRRFQQLGDEEKKQFQREQLERASLEQFERATLLEQFERSGQFKWPCHDFIASRGEGWFFRWPSKHLR